MSAISSDISGRRNSPVNLADTIANDRMRLSVVSVILVGEAKVENILWKT